MPRGEQRSLSGPEMESKFIQLKNLFKKKPIRAYPIYSEEAALFQLYTDFSHIAMGNMLCQKQDGQEKLIAAGGRECSKSESNYGSPRRELSSVVPACRSYDHILRYKKIHIAHRQLSREVFVQSKRSQGDNV